MLEVSFKFMPQIELSLPIKIIYEHLIVNNNFKNNKNLNVLKYNLKRKFD